MKLALGTVQFGLPYGVTNRLGQVSADQAGEMLRLAHAAGVDTLDTASSYGTSESVLGAHDLSGYRIVTKLAALPDDTLDVDAWVHNQVEASLSKLGVAKVEAVLLHRPLQLLDPEGPQLSRAMQRLKTLGLTSKIGMSIYGPDALEPLISQMPCDLIQAPFNLVDRRLESSGWLRRLHQAQIEVHVRSVFLQGLLLVGANELPEPFMPWRDLWGRFEAWQDTAEASALAACLAFAKSYPEISRIVVGAESPQQLNQLLQAYASGTSGPWPDIASNDEHLIDPSQWGRKQVASA